MAEFFCFPPTPEPQDGLPLWDQAQSELRVHLDDVKGFFYVIKIANEWSRYCDKRFVLVPDASMSDIRVGTKTRGFWSQVGTRARLYPGAVTLNLGGLKDLSEEQARRVVLHMFGHALGLEHVHQTHLADWDEKGVHAMFKQRFPGWSEQDVDHRVIGAGDQDRWSEGQTLRYLLFGNDKDSVMLFPYDSAVSWATEMFPLDNVVISRFDKMTIGSIYPKKGPRTFFRGYDASPDGSFCITPFVDAPEKWCVANSFAECENLFLNEGDKEIRVFLLEDVFCVNSGMYNEKFQKILDIANELLIGTEFKFVHCRWPTASKIVVSFRHGTHWSCIGKFAESTEFRQIADGVTLSLPRIHLADLNGEHKAIIRKRILHQFGHALGLRHDPGIFEIEWNRKSVFEFMAQRHGIEGAVAEAALTPVVQSPGVFQQLGADRASVMRYTDFPPEFAPGVEHGPSVVSRLDHAFLRAIYGPDGHRELASDGWQVYKREFERMRKVSVDLMTRDQVVDFNTEEARRAARATGKCSVRFTLTDGEELGQSDHVPYPCTKSRLMEQVEYEGIGEGRQVCLVLDCEETPNIIECFKFDTDSFRARLRFREPGSPKRQRVEEIQ